MTGIWERFCFGSLTRCLRLRWLRARVLFLSLFYNDHCDWVYAGETFIEPAIRLVDNYTQYLGPLFVGFLLGMMGFVVIAIYFVIAPYEVLRKSGWTIGFYCIIGHWILINLLFHYYKAYHTKPGFPPTGTILPQVAGICKHCVAPKPLRTHHCRVCNRCILNMDHHCPWLNQCVGHFNHRYFFFTMFFLWLGCFVLVIAMWPAFVEHYWMEGNVAPWCLRLKDLLFYTSYLCEESEYAIVETLRVTEDPSSTTVPTLALPTVGQMVKTCILLVFFTAAAVTVGIGALVAWHLRLISRGETSIEQHINQSTRKKYATEQKVYKNPYDFGVKENFRIFLGISQSNRTFWRHVLFPSGHAPEGDGITWRMNMGSST